MTLTLDRTDAAQATRIPRAGMLLGLAAALVGLNRPAVGSITPTIALVVAAFVVTIVTNSRRTPATTTLELVLVVGLTTRIIAEFIDTQASRTPFGTGMVADAVLVLVALYVVRSIVVTTRDAVVLAWCVVVPAAGVAVVALAQTADLPGVNSGLVRLMRGSGLQARLDNGWEVRATSTIGHWTALGGYLAATVAIGCALLIHLHRTGRPTRLLTLLLALMAGGQVATFTFATIAVTALVLMSTVVIVRPRPRTVVIGAVVAAGAWFSVADVFLARFAKQQSANPYSSTDSLIPESIRFRMTVWDRETMPAAVDSLLTGHGSLVYRYIGTGIAPRSLSWESPESEWLRTLVSFGALALMVEIVAVCFVLSAVWRLAIRYRATPFVPLAVLVSAMVPAMAIHSHLYDRAFSMLFWSIGVVALALHRERNRHDSH